MTFKSRLNGWLYKNRNKGIPKLMLWVAIGNLIVYLMTSISTNGGLIYDLLCFQTDQILHGQVWRIVTFVFTYMTDCGLLVGAISLFFYYWIGQVLEQYLGTLRFNLFYFSGILISAVVVIVIQLIAVITGLPIYSRYLSAEYINLSLFLAVATIQPEAQVRIWFVLPVKMKWLAWIDIIFTVIGVITGIVQMIIILPEMVFLGWLIPIAALANYFIFFGSQMANLLPDRLRYHHSKPKKVKAKTTKANPNWAASYRSSTGARAYRFKCTVCGRTDTSNPGLEFRYCSRCTGYRCYCRDHINDHAHITE